MSATASDETAILERARSMLGSEYMPSEDEDYMSERQRAYFQMLLIDWKRSIHMAAGQTLQSLADGPMQEADLNDRASSETDWGIELRTRDRQRKLVTKIEAALRRIEAGEYGYCEVTGDPIGLKRLIARPVATMTVEAQEAHERREKVSRDD
ncbi:MAG: RNA polymerase-binding protein DksA [Erythrobacter sp.]